MSADVNTLLYSVHGLGCEIGIERHRNECAQRSAQIIVVRILTGVMLSAFASMQIALIAHV
jgi:hypothetical protein